MSKIACKFPDLKICQALGGDDEFSSTHCSAAHAEPHHQLWSIRENVVTVAVAVSCFIDVPATHDANKLSLFIDNGQLKLDEHYTIEKRAQQLDSALSLLYGPSSTRDAQTIVITFPGGRDFFKILPHRAPPGSLFCLPLRVCSGDRVVASFCLYFRFPLSPKFINITEDFGVGELKLRGPDDDEGDVWAIDDAMDYMSKRKQLRAQSSSTYSSTRFPTMGSSVAMKPGPDGLYEKASWKAQQALESLLSLGLRGQFDAPLLRDRDFQRLMYSWSYQHVLRACVLQLILSACSSISARQLKDNPFALAQSPSQPAHTPQSTVDTGWFRALDLAGLAAVFLPELAPLAQKVLTKTGEAQREAVAMSRSLLFAAPPASLFATVFGSSLSESTTDFAFDTALTSATASASTDERKHMPKSKDKSAMDTLADDETGQRDRDRDRDKDRGGDKLQLAKADGVFGTVLTFAPSDDYRGDSSHADTGEDETPVSPGQWGNDYGKARGRKKNKALSPISADRCGEAEISARHPTRGAVRFVPNCGVVPLKQLLKLCVKGGKDKDSKQAASPSSPSGSSGYSRFLNKHKFERGLHYCTQRWGSGLLMTRAGVQKLIGVLRNSDSSEATMGDWLEQNVLMKM